MNHCCFILALMASLVFSTTRVAGQIRRNSGLLHRDAEASPADLVLYTARVPVRPESREVFLTATTTLAELARRETGCVEFGIYEASDARGTFLIVEEWASQDALSSHHRQAYELAYEQQLAALLAAPASTTVFRVSARTVRPLLPGTR